VTEQGRSARSLDAVQQEAAAVIDSALRGDRDAVVGAFDAAVDRGGVRGAYEVAWCLAATVVGDAATVVGDAATVEQAPLGEFAALDFPGIDQARYDARWVARFVSACANSDLPMGHALFGAAMADGQLSQCLVTLAGTTVATLRHRGAAGQAP